MNFLNIFKTKKPDAWDGIKDEHRIIPAFQHEGIQYYQFEDTFNACSGRSFAALDFYQEHRMSTTREFLALHVDVVEQKIKKAQEGMLITNDTLDFNKVNDPIKEIRILNDQLKQRLDMILGYETCLKLACVVFFTKDEKPYDFDYKYNIENKLPAFKRMDESFFLLMRTADLIPYGDMSEKDLRDYATTQQKIHDHQLENLLSQSSEDFKKTEHYKKLDLLMSTALEKLT